MGAFEAHSWIACSTRPQQTFIAFVPDPVKEQLMESVLFFWMAAILLPNQPDTSQSSVREGTKTEAVVSLPR